MSAQEFARDEPDMDFQNYKRNIKSHFYIRKTEIKRENKRNSYLNNGECV